MSLHERLTYSNHSYFQFLERFYDLMVNNNDDLTLKDMLNAFSNIARFVNSCEWFTTTLI